MVSGGPEVVDDAACVLLMRTVAGGQRSSLLTRFCLRFVLNGASIHLWQVRQIAFPFLSRQTFLTVCRDVLLVGVGDEELMRHILHLCSLTLPSGGCF